MVMRYTMRDIARIFKALSDPTRIRILRLLRDGDLCVCELMYVLGMEQSRISHQMRVLREAQLVEGRREGRWIIYGIPDRSRGIIEETLAGVMRRHLDSAPEIREDARRLGASLKKNLRSALCAAGDARGPGPGSRQRSSKEE
jgi:ArsR family transcriptional regulator